MGQRSRQARQAQRQAKQPPIILPGAIGGVAGTVPGTAGAMAAMAAGTAGEAALAALSAKVAAAVVATLARIARRRVQAMRERMLAAGAPEADVDRQLALEAKRELVFEAKAKARVEAGMRLATKVKDESARAAAINAVLRREQIIAKQRARASAERVLASAELEELRRVSPQGAFWKLGIRRTHTADCRAMAGRFWPWAVLNEVHPLLHPECGCELHSLGEAIAEGWMSAGDIPTEAAALRLAAPVIAHVRAEKAEAERLYGLEESAGHELAIREALAETGTIPIADLAASPLRADLELRERFNPAERRDRTGKWTKGIQQVSGSAFHDAITKAMGADDRGLFLSPYSKSEYGKMRCFTTADGKAGGALKSVKGGKEIVSVFRAADGEKGSGAKVLHRLISEGGDRLDCLGEGLRSLYESLGFKVTETMEWDDQYAPPGWDKSAHGTPSVYVMRR